MTRNEKAIEVLKKRQIDLIPFLDDVYSSQNMSAIIRSSDSVGCFGLYYATKNNKAKKLHKTITQGSHKWVVIEKIEYEKRINFLKQKQTQGFQIVATHLDNSTISFREVDFTKPTIIVVGNEVEGVSKEIVEIADYKIKIPMMGMAQSLNVSVASAIILYEAQRQREQAKMYQTPQIPLEVIEQIAKKWEYRDKIANKSKGKINLSGKLWLDW